jgi:AraC family transcriptional regulator
MLSQESPILHPGSEGHPDSEGAAPSPQHPLDFYNEERVAARHTIFTKRLIVDRQLQVPALFESDGFTHHILPFKLQSIEHEVVKIEDQEYAGAFARGEFLLGPAHRSGFSKILGMKTLIDSVVFMIEPSGLEEFAVQTDCLPAHQVELLAAVKTYDPQVDAFAVLFQNEINTGGLGGQLYADSLANAFLVHLLRHHCTFVPKLKDYRGGLSRQKLDLAIAYIQDHLSDFSSRNGSGHQPE